MNKNVTFLAYIKVRLMSFMMGAVLPDCVEVSRRVSDAMDNKLSIRQLVGMRLHLMICKFCSYYEKQLHLIRTAIRSGSVGIDEPSGHLSDEARARINNALRSCSDQD